MRFAQEFSTQQRDLSLVWKIKGKDLFCWEKYNADTGFHILLLQEAFHRITSRTRIFKATKRFQLGLEFSCWEKYNPDTTLHILQLTSTTFTTINSTSTTTTG